MEHTNRTSQVCRARLAFGIACVALALALGAAAVLLWAQRPLAYEPWEAPITEEDITRRGAVEGVRRLVTESALSIVGEVHYFWGGKSESVGKDPTWGEPRLVESEGSESTGTVRPWGLDCSGFVSWCFLQDGLSFREMKHVVGNGTMNQWKLSYPVSWDDLKTGDLIFQYDPQEGKGNHVGIVVGFTEKDEPLIAHCAASFDGVVVTGRGELFVHPRRPCYYGD